MKKISSVEVLFNLEKSCRIIKIEILRNVIDARFSNLASYILLSIKLLTLLKNISLY